MSARVLFNRLPALARRLGDQADAAVREALLAVELDVKSQMAAPKSGRAYGGHVASAPGEAPAVDTGAYLNDIHVRVTGRAQGAVGTGQEQAAALEFGGARVAARPAWRPAARRVSRQFIARMRSPIR